MNSRLEKGIFTVYLLLVLSGVVYHEAWRDEIRALVISIHASSWDGLLRLLANEGHPSLWYLFLKPFSIFPGGLIGLKIAGLVSGLVASWSLFGLSSLPLWIRTGILFSYYWLYEYVIVSRSYSLAFALTTLGLLLVLRRRNQIVGSLLLGLAANTHVMIALINLPLIVLLLVVGDLHKKLQPKDLNWRRSALALVLVLSLNIIGFGTAMQPNAIGNGVRKINSASLPTLSREKPRQSVFSNLAAIISSQMSMTVDTTMIEEVLQRQGGPEFISSPTAIQSKKWFTLLILVCLLTAMTCTSFLVVITYTMPSLIIFIVFSQFIYGGATWHLGLPFMVLVYSLILCRGLSSPNERSSWLHAPWAQALRSHSLGSRLGVLSLTVMLLLSAAHGLRAWSLDLRIPFSGAQQARDYLLAHGVKETDVLIQSPYLAEPISAIYGFRALRTDNIHPPRLLPWPSVLVKDDSFLCAQALSMSRERPGPMAIVMDSKRDSRSKGCGKRPPVIFFGIRESVSVQLVP